MTSPIRTWWLLLFIKMVLAASLPLSNDEAYYWVWSHHLQLSYFDHPFMVALLFKMGHIFENFFHAARWPAVILSHLSLILWIDLLKPYMSNKQLNFWLILITLTPFTGIGSIIVTPDLPLTIFWTLGIWLTHKAFSQPKNLYFACLGLIIGLGFSAKYHMALFVPFTMVALFFTKKLHTLSLQRVFLGVFFFLLGASPVFIWNYLNDFISFKFQLNHGLGQTSWTPMWTFTYIVGQLCLLFPTTFMLTYKRKDHNFTLTLLYFLGWLPLFFFLLTSFKGHVEANWPIIAYLPLLSLAVINNPNLKLLKINIVFFALLNIYAISDSLLAWTPQKLRITKLHEYKQFSDIEKLYTQYKPLYAHSFQMASQLSYRLREPIYKLHGVNRKDFYDFREESIPQTFRYFVVVVKGESLPTWAQKNKHTIIARHAVNNKYEILEVHRP